MKRDFTDDNFNQIKQYLDDADDENKVWDNVITFFVAGLIPSISSFFTKLISSIVSLFIRNDDEPSGEELKWYYNHVVEENESLRHCLKQVFDKANGADTQYAQRGEKLLSSGREILKELEYLIEIATPNGISNIAKSKVPNIIISSILDDTSAISDEELIAYCKGHVKVDYLSMLTEANQAILDIDGMDMFLVMLFNFKDISVDAIVEYLNGNGCGNTRKWITEQILNGGTEFSTVQEIADRVGCDIEDVTYYLETGRLRTQGLTKDADYNNTFENDVSIKNGIDRILAENIKKIFADDELLEQYCNDNNLSIEHVKAIRDDNYSGYEKNLYYKNVGSIIEKTCGSAEYKKNFDMQLSDTKKILGTIKDGNKIWGEYTEEGKILKKMWDNKILSEAEARKFLKSCCGYETVSDSDIKFLRGLTDNINHLGGATKIMGNTQKGLDAIAYWTTDFSQEIEMLDSLIENAPGDSSYAAALQELRTKYTNQFQTSLEDAVVSLEKKVISGGVEKVIDAIPVVKLVDTVVDVTGKVTGAGDYTGNIIDLMAYPEVSSQMLEAYNNSVANVASGDPEAVTDVRLSFTALKQTLSTYYDKNCTFYEQNGHGSTEDHKRLAYSGYMKDKIDNMELGKPFEFLSYNEYIEQNSIQ